jgi:hypothetical protein
VSNAPIRVTFIHGLEGSPNGAKILELRKQGFEVRAVDMHMSLWSLDKRNSAARNLLRVPEPRRALAITALSAGIGMWRGSPFQVLSSAAALGAWAWVRHRTWMKAALTRSFETCVKIQKAELARSQPDILVGSSWGGAVAAQLVLDGAWSGPTIMLAPAVGIVNEWTGHLGDADIQRLHELSRKRRMAIFHDPADETVPHRDSLQLVQGSEVALHTVDGGGHSLVELVERGELGDEIRNLVARAGESRGGASESPPS